MASQSARSFIIRLAFGESGSIADFLKLDVLAVAVVKDLTLLLSVAVVNDGNTTARSRSAGGGFFLSCLRVPSALLLFVLSLSLAL